jgi:hypothetical protein
MCSCNSDKYAKGTEKKKPMPSLALDQVVFLGIRCDYEIESEETNLSHKKR